MIISRTQALFVEVPALRDDPDPHPVAVEPEFDIVGLSSAQWNHRLSPDDTVQKSQDLNEALLRLMDRVDIPDQLPVGLKVGQRIVGDPEPGKLINEKAA